MCLAKVLNELCGLKYHSKMVMEARKIRLEMRKTATLLSSFQQNKSPTIHQVRATDDTIVVK